MARIIKKAVASSIITPVVVAYTRRIPRRNYSTCSIFITPQLNNNNTISRLIHQILTPTRDFSSSLGNKGSSGSGKMICTGEEHLLKKVLETPSEFPFKIEDKPGEQTVTLTRKYQGDDIKVIVHMPVEERGDKSVDQNHDHEHKNSFSDPQSSIRLVVTSTNFLGTTLEYGVIAYRDDFSIDSFCIKYANGPEEENIYYKGPDYAKLDKNLQKEFHRRLKIRGIIPSTTNFLHEYMANRDMYSTDSSSSPPTTTITPSDQSTPESVGIRLINDEGIPVDYVIEVYRQRGHPLVSAEDIRNSGKNPKDFVWIPYPYTRSEKLLWIEVPRKGYFVSQSELEDYGIKDDDSNLFLDGEAYNTNPYSYSNLPPKAVGNPPFFSEEMDKILYPDLKNMTDPKKAWDELGVAQKAYDDEMDKILFPDGPPVHMSDSDLEYYQVYCM
ncbi:hypothetical protein MKX03_019764 [Papaver bracteatum]|nr:hypothetical protein MKX03_019764 [Papaver bracteatum]